MDLEITNSAPDVAEQKRRRRQPRIKKNDAKGRAKGEKLDQRGRPAHGRIWRIQYGQGNGFIRVEGRRDVFFHRKDVREGSFNALQVGDPVELELIDDELTGPRAVRVAPRHA